MPIKEALVWLGNHVKQGIVSGKNTIALCETNIEALKARLKKLRVGIGSLLLCLLGAALIGAFFYAYRTNALMQDPVLVLSLAGCAVLLLVSPFLVHQSNQMKKRDLQTQIRKQHDTINQVRGLIL